MNRTSSAKAVPGDASVLARFDSRLAYVSPAVFISADQAAVAHAAEPPKLSGVVGIED